MYSPPARDGSRAGAYLFNHLHPGPAGGWGLEAAAFHEGVPGHHPQFARLHLAPDLPLLLGAFTIVARRAGGRVGETRRHARGASRARGCGLPLAPAPMPEPFMAAEIDRYTAMP